MTRWLLIAAIALGGCDSVFGLTYDGPPVGTCLQEPWDGDAIDLARWQYNKPAAIPSVNVAGNAIEIQIPAGIQDYYGIATNEVIDLTGGSFVVDVQQVVTQGPNVENLIDLRSSDNAVEYKILARNGSLRFRVVVDGATDNPYQELYAAAPQRFWRIRHDPFDDQIKFGFGPDADSLTDAYAVDATHELTSMRLSLLTGAFSANATTEAAMYGSILVLGNCVPE